MIFKLKKHKNLEKNSIITKLIKININNINKLFSEGLHKLLYNFFKIQKKYLI